MNSSLLAVIRFPRRYLEEVREVRKGFARRDRNPMMDYFFRPISFLLTPAVVKLGFSPNQVTYFGGGFGIASLVMFALGGQGPWVLGVALFNVYLLMDAVDGNVARVTDRATYLGKFLDGAIDTLIVSLLPAGIGLGLYIETDRFVWFIVGAVSCVVVLLSLYVMTRFSFHREWLKADYLQGTLRDAPRPDPEHGPRGPSIPGSLLFNYLFVGLIVTAIVDVKAPFLVGYLILSAVWGALVLWNHSFAARRVLNVRRASRHSANRGPGPNGVPAATKPEIAGREASGMVIWVTGLSGPGNTTLCNALRRLLKPSTPELALIDGDTLRLSFGDGLRYREEDHIIQVKRLQNLANVLSEQGLVVLVTAMYDQPELLAWNRKNLQNYHEVYLEAPVETVKRRDSKRLYDAARHVVGIDVPWHAPASPDITLDMDDPDGPEVLAQRVIDSVPRFARVPAVR